MILIALFKVIASIYLQCAAKLMVSKEVGLRTRSIFNRVQVRVQVHKKNLQVRVRVL